MTINFDAKLIIHVDGGFINESTQASWAFVVFNPSGGLLFAGFGSTESSQEVELEAVELTVLKYIAKHKRKDEIIFTDCHPSANVFDNNTTYLM